MIEDSNPNLGLYNMTVEIPEDAPQFLHKSFNNHICNKGGGGGQTTTTTSGIDPEFKPYLERVLSDVTKRYEGEVAAGPESIVAALDPAQREAMATQEAMGRAAIEGTGAYDIAAARARDLANLAGTGTTEAYMGGALGTARSQKAMQGALADRSLQLQQQRQADIARGIKELGEAGSARQAYEQTLLDAPHTSASRYFGYLGAAPQTTTQTSSGGGGK